MTVCFFTLHIPMSFKVSDSRLPCGLSCSCAPSWLLGSCFESIWRHGYSSVVIVACCVCSGVCDGLITCIEESYRLCVSDSVWSRDFYSPLQTVQFAVALHKMPGSVDLWYTVYSAECAAGICDFRFIANILISWKECNYFVCRILSFSF